MAFMSRLNVTIPAEQEGEQDITEQYDIASLKLVQATNRDPYNVGDETTPVYFEDGVPLPCNFSGGGGGTGGSNVDITPTYKTGNLIASYKIDGTPGYLYTPRTAVVYKRVPLWSGVSGISNVGDTANLNSSIANNYDFLLIHFAPSNNINEERTMMIDAKTMYSSITSGTAIFSCHYLSNVFIKCKFNTAQNVEVIESSGLPLPDNGSLKCAVKKIEGLSFGVSGEDIDSGLSTRQILWGPSAFDTVGQTGNLKEEIDSYNYIYVHYCTNQNQYEERILILDKEAILKGITPEQVEESQAYFTCSIDDNLYIKGLFNTNKSFTITEVESKTEEQEVIKCIIKQVDGICISAANNANNPVIANPEDDPTDTLNKIQIDNVVYNISGGGSGNYMEKGIDYVTAGRAEGSELGERATAEGYDTYAYGDYSHAEGYCTTAGSQAHAEGVYTYAEGQAAHAEGDNTTALWGAHAEGFMACANGQAAHAEGDNTTASGNGAHAEGISTSSSQGHAEGVSTLTTGYGSQRYGTHAEGYFTSAYNGGHAEGNYTLATMGYQSSDSGSCHVEGYATSGYGDRNSVHVEGYRTSGDGASYYGRGAVHVEGHYTKVNSENSELEPYETPHFGTIHIEGDNNVTRNNFYEYCHIIGGGWYDDRGYDLVAEEKDIVLIDWEGNISCKSVIQSSSRKVKENIQDMTEEEANKILQLRPVSFDYIKNEGDKNCYGLIAEEVQEAGINYPIFDGSMKSKDEKCLQLDYSKFIPYLIKVVQIQDKRIKDLEEELKERKGVK